MRRKYITPEFDNKRVFGTLSTPETKNILSSKMLEIEDSIILDNQSLAYYQNSLGEQIDIDLENILLPVSYSVSDDMRNNHTLVLDPTQNRVIGSKSKWIITIELERILINFLFSTLKRWRTFEGITNDMNRYGNVDFMIRDYIINNVIDRYKFDRVELYLKYVDLGGTGIRKFDNLWAGDVSQLTGRTSITPAQISNSNFLVKGLITETEFNFKRTTLKFEQSQSSDRFCFDYFFKLYYQKI
jgi:hypothetical protein